jgi:hypothetical protein
MADGTDIFEEQQSARRRTGGGEIRTSTRANMDVDEFRLEWRTRESCGCGRDAKDGTTGQSQKVKKLKIVTGGNAPSVESE